MGLLNSIFHSAVHTAVNKAVGKAVDTAFDNVTGQNNRDNVTSYQIPMPNLTGEKERVEFLDLNAGDGENDRGYYMFLKPSTIQEENNSAVEIDIVYYYSGNIVTFNENWSDGQPSIYIGVDDFQQGEGILSKSRNYSAVPVVNNSLIREKLEFDYDGYYGASHSIVYKFYKTPNDERVGEYTVLVADIPKKCDLQTYQNTVDALNLIASTIIIER